MRELEDRLIATAEVVEQRFGEALRLKGQLDDLAAALGAAAQRAAQESQPRISRSGPAAVEDVAATNPYHRA